MINPNTLRSDVRQYVLDMLQQGRILAGDKIREAELCKSLNLSRTPVREALIQLVTEGILESTPHKGFTVTKKSTLEKNNIHIVLASLDSLAAELAVAQMTEQTILMMCQITDMIDVAIRYKDYPEYCRLQQQFHQVYRDICQNEYLQNLLKDMEAGFIPMTFYSEDLDSLFEIFKKMNEEHRYIIQLFKDGKKEELYEFLKNTHWHTRYESMI